MIDKREMPHMRRSHVPDLPSTSIVVADVVDRGHVNAGLHCHAEIQKAYAAAGQAGTAVDLPYGELHSPLVAMIAFKPLLAMVFTLDFAIRNFRSEAFVSVGESAANGSAQSGQPTAVPGLQRQARET